MNGRGAGGGARNRGGFTLAETAVASGAGAIVLGMAVISFMTAQNMLHTAMAESELALAMREMREKLLFKESPDVSGRRYGGLLSGRNLKEDDARNFVAVEMEGCTVGSTVGDRQESSVRLVVESEGGRTMLSNEHSPAGERAARWLRPGMLALSGCTALEDMLGYESRNADGSDIYRLHLDIGIAAGAVRRDGSPVVRRERVSVPVLGRMQPMRDSGGRY